MMLFSLFRASIEGAVLVAGIWLAGRLWSRLSAATLTLLWWCAAAKFLLALVWITPIELRLLPARPIAPAAVDVPAPGAAAHGLTRASVLVEDGGRGNASRPGWAVVAPVVWLGGVGVMLVAGARRWRAIAAVVRRSTGAPAETARLAVEIAGSLGMRTTPRIRMSAEVRTPLVAGIVRPAVVLPAVRFLQLSNTEQRMTLCHELAHVKRADLWFGCVPALAERIFFFHPLVRLAAREYALCREAACDRTVIATLDASPQAYGRLLLALGVAPGRTAAAAAGASWSFLTLKRRISMLRESSIPSRRTRWIAAPIVAAAILAMVPMRLTARPQPSSPSAVGASAPAVALSLAPVADGGEQKERRIFYVLFLDDHSTHMSGSNRDVEIARRHRRNGERLLWFRDGDREYVVRDPSLIDQVVELWRPVSAIGEEQGRVGARQGAIGALQGDIGAKQGAIGARQGVIGAQQGVLGARQGDLARLETRARTEADRRSIEESYRQIDLDMRALDRQMRETDTQMRELQKPMDDLNEQMKVLGREMDVLGRRMDEAVRKAEGEMRTLVDRAIATGAATPVK